MSKRERATYVPPVKRKREKANERVRILCGGRRADLSPSAVIIPQYDGCAD
jgi:hypothetical protein